MPALPPGLVGLDALLLRGGVLLIYLAFVVLTAGALVLARWVKARGSLKLQPGLLSPLGSLYTLTTAFLLSNVIFQFTILRTALTEEVVTINKLGAVMSVLPVDQRIEARRLLYDYADSVAHDEAQAMLLGQRSEITQERIDRLRDFLASPDASLPEGGVVTPESASYMERASDFSFDLIDARERRLSLARQTLPARLWLAIAVMYFALALLAFLVQGGAWTTTWVATILLLAAPVPAVMLFVYANPIANGLIDITATIEVALGRSL